MSPNLTAAALLACISLGAVVVPARADPVFGIAQLAQRISPDAACTRVQVQGVCFCGVTPCGFQVRMYVPVAFVETVRAPGDSLLSAALPVAPASAGTLSSSHSALDHTAEAHAWVLGDAAWQLSGPLPCLRCQPSDARVGPPPPWAAADLACGAVATAVSALSSVSGAASLLPALAFASEVDALNWRTGCRDLLAIGTWGILGPIELGQWGPLHPRQMRDLGMPPVLHSCKTAFRALSIARDQLATFPFPVDASGRMQQAYPAVSTCFGVGEQPLPLAPASARPARISADGRYGWFYWRPTTCCVGFDSLSHCASGSAGPRG